jgi:cell division protein FtsL
VNAPATVRGRGPLVVVLACALVFALVSPLRGMWSARGDVNELRREEQALDARLSALRAERDLLRTDAEVERRARADLGMVRPGEIAVIIPGAEEAPVRVPFLAPEPEDEQEAGDPLLQRWWDAARRAARIGV